MTTFAVTDAPTVSPVDQAAAYAELTRAAIDARKAMDTGRWLLGEYTRMLLDTTVYGAHTIEEFADAISIDAKRLYEFGAMATYYTPKTRESLAGLNLTYSHMREARRLKDLNKSIAFLQKASLNVWTLTQTREAIKAYFSPDAPPAFSDGPAMTDTNNRPFNPRPVYEWRGPAMVSFDEKGIVRLQCDSVPDLDPDKRYMVSFEEY